MNHKADHGRRRTFPVWGALLLAQLALPALAQAQGTNRVDLTLRSNLADVLCGQRSTAPLDTACTGGGMSAHATAAAAYGLLHLSTSVTGPVSGGYAEANATTEWLDQLFFTSGPIATTMITFGYAFNGSTTVAAPGGAGEGVCTVNRMTVGTPGPLAVLDAWDGVSSGRAHCQPGQRSWNLSGAVTRPVPPGTTNLYINLVATSHSIISVASSLGLAGIFPASASGDFTSTGGITGITFHDANGNVINNVQYSFAQGLQFYTPEALSTVPEPATWALMLTGLACAGMIGMRRRRTPKRDHPLALTET